MIGTASRSIVACSRMTCPIRGCWTTERHSAGDSEDGFSRISCGMPTLPTSWRRAAIRVFSGPAHGGAATGAVAGAAGHAEGDGHADLAAVGQQMALAGHDEAELVGQDGRGLDAGLGQADHEILAAVSAAPGG